MRGASLKGERASPKVTPCRKSYRVYMSCDLEQGSSVAHKKAPIDNHRVNCEDAFGPPWRTFAGLRIIRIHFLFSGSLRHCVSYTRSCTSDSQKWWSRIGHGIHHGLRVDGSPRATSNVATHLKEYGLWFRGDPKINCEFWMTIWGATFVEPRHPPTSVMHLLWAFSWTILI